MHERVARTDGWAAPPAPARQAGRGGTALAAAPPARTSVPAGHDFASLRVHPSPRTGPAPLPPAVRARMERELGGSLAGLRVDAGAGGERVASSHGALAVQDAATVHMRPSAYAPGSDHGDRLLRHEAAHYLQRRAAASRPGPAWPSALLEAEADQAALGRGGAIAGRAGGAPLLRRTFVSTVGGNPYLEMAVKFYKLWEGETAERIGSYQDVVDKLSTDATPLSQFRIVAHANGLNLFLPLLQGAQNYAGLPELGLQTQKDVEKRLGTMVSHLAGDDSATVWGWVKKSTTGAALLAKVGLTAAPKDDWQEWFRWVIDEHFATNAREAKGKGATSAADRKALLAEVADYQAIARKRVVAALPAGAAAADVDALKGEIMAAYAAEGWKWSEINTGALKGALDSFRQPDVLAMKREARAGTWEGKLAAVKARVSDKTDLEIRGCNIGQNDAYLNGIREFFGTKPKALPSISAPKMYQFFGTPGPLVVPQGGKQPPVADSLKFLFEETFDDASLAKDVKAAVKKAKLNDIGGLAAVLRHADVKAEFNTWWKMKQTQKGVKDADLKDATLADFQDFISTQKKTFPINAPGVGAESLWYMILLPDSAIDTMLRWVKDQGYTLPGGKDPLKEFFGGSNKLDAGKFGKQSQKIIVDWLGDNYPVPDHIFFPEDPTYKANIRRLP